MPDQFGGVEVEDEWGGIAVEEESAPLDDRPPRGEMLEPPSRPSYSLDEPVLGGKPLVNVEGSTRAMIPASLDVPELQRVITPFSADEFTRGDVATPEQRAFTAAQPSEFDQPVIPPGLFKTALDIGSATLPHSEMLEGFKEGAAEQLSGMTSQSSAAMLPAFAIPYVGPALAMGMGAKAVGTGAGTAVAGLEADDPRAVGQGLSEVAGGGLMVAAPLMHGGITRPAIPPRITETIARTEAAAPGALSKAKAALADTAKREPISDQVQQLEKPIEKGVPDENDILFPTARTVRAADIIPTQKATEAQGPKDVLKDVSREKEIEIELSNLAARRGRFDATNPRMEALRTELRALQAEREAAQPAAEQLVQGGNKITKETVPERVAVQAEQVMENGETVPGYVTIQSRGNAQSGPVEAWRAAGHEIPDTAGLPSGIYTVAELKARANEKAIPAATEAATPAAANQTPIPARQAPVVEPRVGAVPQDVPALGAEAKAVERPVLEYVGQEPAPQFTKGTGKVITEAGVKLADVNRRMSAIDAEQRRIVKADKQAWEKAYDEGREPPPRSPKLEELDAERATLREEAAGLSAEDKAGRSEPAPIPTKSAKADPAALLPEPAGPNVKAGVELPAASQAVTEQQRKDFRQLITPEKSAELEQELRKDGWNVSAVAARGRLVDHVEISYRAKKLSEADTMEEGWRKVMDGEVAPPEGPTEYQKFVAAELDARAAVKAQPELPGTQLGAAESKLAEVVNQTIEQSSPTRLGASPAATMRPMDVVLGAPDLRSMSPVVEARWQQAVKGTEGIIAKVKTQAEEAWKSITREYADLPPREFPAEIDVLRRLRASRNASARTTVDVLKGITNNLGPKQYGVFNRVALLEDLVKDVEAGKYASGQDLPFGYQNAGELTADLNKFRVVAEATPQIRTALARRREFMDSLRSTLVERGFLPESILQDPRYFHHQVLLYMAEKNAPSGSRSFRDWFSGWQKKRTGSSQDYNRQYVEAEAEVLSDAFNKIAMQDLQGEMRGIADLTAELKELHGAEWRQHIPKTHTLWQPKQGNAFYPVQTVAERVMDRYLSGLGDILPSEFKEALAMGARKQEWVVPKPLAKVLDNIAPRPDNWIGRLATTAQNSWKRYILLNPLRAAKYNLNNLSGDLDFLFAAQPKIFKEFKSSASDMWGFHVKGKSAVGDIKEAMQDGVIGSGWRASELPDIARSDYFSWLTGEKPKLVDRYWNWIGKRSDAREDTGRLASYRFAKKEWEAGRPFYGASVPADVNALATPRLKAAKVAREILIDYGRGTEFSNFTRQKLVPFFKWMEGNFVRYQQLIRNIPEHEGAGPRVAGAAGKKAAALALRMGAAYGIINLWNHMFFPKEEEELGEGRNQLHLILGRDDQGNVQTIRFQGALSDLLGWVGGEDLPQDVKDVATGKASVGDKMEDAYEAGISRAVNASLPFPKTAAEIGLGRSFYPNALSPRPVRDKAEHAAGLFSLKPVYQWLAGKPHKPLRQEIANLISYTTDPGEAAYNTTRHMAGEWLEDQGEERANVIPGKRSNALYYYKQALRYKDQATAQKFLDEYNRLGGKREGLNQSIKASAPLSMLGTKRKAFLDSLSPQEQEAVRRAEEWYRRVYAQPPTPNPNP